MKLVDAAIFRDDGETMARRYNGRIYVAQRAYSDKSEADEYANSFRKDGGVARVTQERKPRRVRTSQRYMWVVWTGPAEYDPSLIEEAVCP